jgi:O-Antigen ligase
VTAYVSQGRPRLPMTVGVTFGAVLTGLATALSPVAGAILLATTMIGLVIAVSGASPIAFLTALLVLVRSIEGLLERTLGDPVRSLPDLLLLLLLVFCVPSFARRLGAGVRAPIWAFVGWSVIMGAPSLYLSSQYGALGIRALIVPLVTGLCIAEVCRRRQNLVVVLVSLFVGFAFNAIVAARQLLFGYTGAEEQSFALNDSTYLVGDQLRTLGALVSNQDFGLYIGFMTVFILSCLIYARQRWQVLTLSVLYVASLSLLLSSLLRGVLVAAAVASLYLLFTFRRRLAVLFWPGVLLTSGAVAMWAAMSAFPAGQQRFDATLARASSLFQLQGDRSYLQRTGDTLPAAWHAFSAHPLGLGPGSAGPISQAFSSQAPLGRVIPDNGFLLIGIQLGIVGLGILAWVLARFVRQLWVSRKGNDFWSNAGVALIIYWVVAMLTGGYWSLAGPASLFWAITLIAVMSAQVTSRRARCP